jgi:hypothetical protein
MSAGVIVVLGVLGWGYARFGSVRDTLLFLNGQRVFVRPHEVDCGEGHLGEIREGKVVVRNESDEDLQVIGCKSTCSCVASGPFPIVIRPRKSQELTVKVGYGPKRGEFQHELSFLTDSDYLPAFSILVRGRVTAKGLAEGAK